MDRKQLTGGLSEIGLGIIIFITVLEIPMILTHDTKMELLIFSLEFYHIYL
jgi:hypothetical protein